MQKSKEVSYEEPLSAENEYLSEKEKTATNGVASRSKRTKSRSSIPYPEDTSKAIETLRKRYMGSRRAIPVSFRKLVPWMKVGERATHYLHPYPAKLLPQIAHFFLSSNKFCPTRGVVLDPFGGSGTVALEACLSGRRAVYVDTNPLARLIAKTKLWDSTGVDFEITLNRVKERFKKSRTTAHPDVINVSKWFDPQVIRALARIRAAIRLEEDEKIKEFLDVTFSATVRRVSNADLRLSVPVLAKSKNLQIRDASDVWLKFEEQFRSNARRSSELRKIMPNDVGIEIFGDDARSMTPNSGGIIRKASVDLVITSPPYAGAQKYIRASSLCLGWLGLAGTGQLKPLENKTIGREHLLKNEVKNISSTSVSSANKVLARIRQKNPVRAAICSTYLNEMEQVIKQVSEVIKAGGYFVLVIGNNEVCGEKFLSSRYLAELASNSGFDLEMKMVDEIKSRGLMTKRNRSAGIIAREWVLVFKKANIKS